MLYSCIHMATVGVKGLKRGGGSVSLLESVANPLSVCQKSHSA